MSKIKQLFKDRSGSSMILGSFIAICLFVVTLVIVEYWHFNVIGWGIRDTMQSIITTACTENYDRLYNGMREGYSGGYKLTGGNWTENIDTGDIYTELDNVLGTRAEGGEHIKYANSKTTYSLSDLTVQMSNTPFAPDDPQNANKFTGVAYITLRVPFAFGWGALPPMETRLKVTAGYMAKF